MTLLAGSAAIIALTLIGCAGAASGCSADANGNQVGPGSTVRVNGDQGLRPYDYAGPAGQTIDARSAVFTVANSRNSAPSPGSTCEQGALPTNPYPVTIEGAAGVTLTGDCLKARSRSVQKAGRPGMDLQLANLSARLGPDQKGTASAGPLGDFRSWLVLAVTVSRRGAFGPGPKGNPDVAAE